MRNGTGSDHEDVGSEPEQLDLRRLRISQRFGEGLDIKPVLSSVTARKPHRQWWIQTHPDPEMGLVTCVLQYEYDKWTIENKQFVFELAGEARGLLHAGKNVLAARATGVPGKRGVLLQVALDEVRPSGAVLPLKAVVCDQCSTLPGQMQACVHACPHDAAKRVDAWTAFPAR